MRQSIVKLPGQVCEADLAGCRPHHVTIRLRNRAELLGELYLGAEEGLEQAMISARRFVPFKGADGSLRSISKDMIAAIEELH